MVYGNLLLHFRVDAVSFVDGFPIYMVVTKQEQSTYKVTPIWHSKTDELTVQSALPRRTPPNTNHTEPQHPPSNPRPIPLSHPPRNPPKHHRDIYPARRNRLLHELRQHQHQRPTLRR